MKIIKCLKDYLPAFTKALEDQLEKDQARWGDTWKHRPKEDQEKRAFNRFYDYYDQWLHAGTPIPWLKIAGECVIAWVRENYPDYHE